MTTTQLPHEIVRPCRLVVYKRYMEDEAIMEAKRGGRPDASLIGSYKITEYPFDASSKTAKAMRDNIPIGNLRDFVRIQVEGIDYFETAAHYGETLSETNLGVALRNSEARPNIATEVRLQECELTGIPGAITRSLEGSLSKLQVGGVHPVPAQPDWA